MRDWYGVPRALWMYAGIALTGGAITWVQTAYCLTATDWATWAQAVFTAAAIGGAYFLANWQSNKAERERISLGLLGLQGVAGEIAQMCLLAGFQKQDPFERTIYADIPQEFQDMADRLDRFPVDRVVECGEMETMLHLRRICLEMGAIHTRDMLLPGKDFVLRNRDKIFELESHARTHGIRLAEQVREIGIRSHIERIRSHL